MTSQNFRTAETPFISGGFGHIYMAVSPTGVPCIAKVLEEERVFKHEMDMMFALPVHKNIIRLIHADPESKTLYMMYGGQSLYDIVEHHHTSMHVPPCMDTIWPQVFAAVQALHEGGIVHRDIKLENIVVDAHGVVRLIDFGLGKSSRIDACTQVCGSALYVAPEVYDRREAHYHGKYVDLWALGIAMFASFCNFFPWREARMSDARFKRFHFMGGGSVVQSIFSLQPGMRPPHSMTIWIPVINALIQRNPVLRCLSYPTLVQSTMPTPHIA